MNRVRVSIGLCTGIMLVTAACGSTLSSSSNSGSSSAGVLGTVKTLTSACSPSRRMGQIPR